jgi:hypothetical protein
MLAHSLSIRPGQFGSQRANTLVQLLQLGLTQNGAWGLVL